MTKIRKIVENINHYTAITFTRADKKLLKKEQGIDLKNGVTIDVTLEKTR